MKKNILIVGGAGYIGSHMVLAVRDAGHSPIVFDNLSRGHADAVGDAPLFEGDLRSPSDLDACFSKHPVDVVMHFAALAYVGESVHKPELYYENNVIGALNLISAMRRAGRMRLVFSSTCSTYGEPRRIPITEDHPQDPINPYGRTKLMVEHALQDYAVAHGLQSVSLRYFNAAGCDPLARAGERHDPETHLIPLVLQEAMRTRDGGDPGSTGLRVFGSDFPTKDGSCVRDYIHVSDLCDAHLAAADRLCAGSVSGAEAYNLANGVGFTVLEVIDACRQVTGQPIEYRPMERRAGDPATLIGDCRRALDALAWRPKHADLKAIIRTHWNWMEKQKSLVASG